MTMVQSKPRALAMALALWFALLLARTPSSWLVDATITDDHNLSGQCQSDPHSVTLEGVRIQVAAPVNTNKDHARDFMTEMVRSWEEATGGIVDLVEFDSKAAVEDHMIEDLSTGRGEFDGYFTKLRDVPEFAGLETPDGTPALLGLDALVMNSATLNWMGVHSVYRDQLTRYNGHVYGIPFDGDQIILYYRRDLQERDGWQVPRTWDELVELAKQYDGQDLNGDGEPDYAMCQPTKHWYSHLYAPLTGLLQTHPAGHHDVKDKVFPKRHGVYFDLGEDGLESLVDNAAVRRVLLLMHKIYKLGPKEDVGFCCSTKDEGAEKHTGHGLFRTGRCAFYFSFPSAGTEAVRRTMEGGNGTTYPYQHGRMGTAQLPGWTEYLDRDTDTLKSCTVAECPTSIPLDLAGATDSSPCVLLTGGARLNRASWYSNGGQGAIINGKVDALRQMAVFSFFSYVSYNVDTRQAGMVFNPFRYPDHFVVDNYVEAGWDPADAKLYLEAIMKSLNALNVVQDLRVPYVRRGGTGFFDVHADRFYEYHLAMNETVFDQEAILESTIAALDADVRAWIHKYDNRIESGTPWMGSIEKMYREGLDLPLRSEPTSISFMSLGSIRWYGWSLATLVVLSSLAFAAWTIHKRKKRVVKASQPLFLFIIDAGALIMGLSIFPLGIDHTIASDDGCSIACMAFPWLASMGFTISFSALYCKISRINKLFAAPRFTRLVVKEKDVLKPFLVLFALNLAVLLTWSFVDPLTWQYVPTSDPATMMGLCKGKSSLAAIFLLVTAAINWLALALANVQAFKARHISDEFSESKYIAIAMALAAQALLLAFPILILVHDNPKADFFVKSSMVFVIAMSLSLSIFIPKIIMMRTTPHYSVRTLGEGMMVVDLAASTRTATSRNSWQNRRAPMEEIRVADFGNEFNHDSVTPTARNVHYPTNGDIEKRKEEEG